MRAGGLTPVLVGAGLAGLFAALLLGSTPLGPADVLQALFGSGTAANAVVIWEIRLPRALAAYAVGMALGTSGAALQGLLRNPLAEPGVLGVSATASLAATTVIYWGLAGLSPLIMPLSAMAGGVVATLLIALIGVRTSSVVALILIGAALSSFAGALMSLLMATAPNPFSLADMVNWSLGSVANRSLEDLALGLPFLGIGLAILIANRRGLSALSLGEEAAMGVGLDLARARLAVTLGAGLAAGAAVSLAGSIGFVGIVSAHLVRPLVNQDPARTLIPAGLMGGLILVVSDIGVRLLPTETELRLGVVAALVGAPVFAWIAARRQAAYG